jgi:hypothetical protein
MDSSLGRAARSKKKFGSRSMGRIMATLLFIKPTRDASPIPLIDHLTRKLCAAFRKATDPWAAAGLIGGWMGCHECVCGALSSNKDHLLPNGALTNSLCVHYLAHHRAEVPPTELAAVEAFDCGEAEPTDEELQGPERILARVREKVEKTLGPDRLRLWTEWGLDGTALALGLRGGNSRWDPGYETREDTAALLNIISAIPTEATPLVGQVLLQRHGGPRAWVADALRVPRWSRAAWVGLLDGLLRVPPEDPLDPQSVAESVASELACHWSDRREDGYALPEEGAVVPTLLELAKNRSRCQEPLIDALDEIGRIPGVLVPETAVPALVEVAQGSQYGPGLRAAAARLLGCTGRDVRVAGPAGATAAGQQVPGAAPQ